MLVVADLVNTKGCEKNFKMTETLSYGYSFDSTQRELANEYQHDRVLMVSKKLCIIGSMFWEGLYYGPGKIIWCRVHAL